MDADFFSRSEVADLSIVAGVEVVADSAADAAVTVTADAFDVTGITGGRKLTPMLKQYLEAKAECGDAILLFRMGDFYELFFEDAKLAARELDLTLTAREKSDDPIPMAGVPHHAVSSYIARLVERGYTVAVCDQIEDPRKAKGIVKRQVTRLVTPGTTTDLEALEPGAAAYLAYVGRSDTSVSGWAVALLDLLAGEILITECDGPSLADELRRMNVKELLTEAELRDELLQHLRLLSLPVRMAAEPAASDAEISRSLVERFGVGAVDSGADCGSPKARLAVWRAVAYAESTQRRRLPHLSAPRAYRISDFLVLDEATRRNLELCTTQVDAEKKGSLRWHLDRCRTAMGSRLLLHWLLFPLRSSLAINLRLDAVQSLKDNRSLREELSKALDGVRDIERLVGRVAVGRANPRDLGALAGSLVQAAAVKMLMADGQQGSPLGTRWHRIDEVTDVRELLQKALADELPIQSTEGGIFRRGYDAALDELITLATEGHDFLADLERRERVRTGIQNLKVRYNRVFGYYIEVTRANLGQVPASFIRKQTLVGAERFITEELKAFEDKVLTADERRRQRELELFEALVTKVAGHIGRLRHLSRLVAETDAVASLAQVADEGRYSRPEVCQQPVLELVESRHPVLERLMPAGERFVPNDVRLDANERQLVIVTGPNMAGKSTVMRQAALCTILAHMGSFVPAKRALVGLCDRLFTRVGASDNLTRGQSTFMVEMVETASILRHATRDSLVLLDEIGRGTSTFDGVSIAWAVAEHLHDLTRCRAMFATHYHELTDLARERPHIVNMSVAVKERDGRVVFLRRLVEGGANRSYGIQVAELAGVPCTVLDRAREILANLEQGELDESGMPRLARSKRGKGSMLASSQLSLFALQRRGGALNLEPNREANQVAAREPSEVEKALAALDPMNMTPMDALATLDRLKKLLPAVPK